MVTNNDRTENWKVPGASPPMVRAVGGRNLDRDLSFPDYPLAEQGRTERWWRSAKSKSKTRENFPGTHCNSKTDGLSSCSGVLSAVNRIPPQRMPPKSLSQLRWERFSRSPSLRTPIGLALFWKKKSHYGASVRWERFSRFFWGFL